MLIHYFEIPQAVDAPCPVVAPAEEPNPLALFASHIGLVAVFVAGKNYLPNKRCLGQQFLKVSVY